MYRNLNGCLKQTKFMKTCTFKGKWLEIRSDHFHFFLFYSAQGVHFQGGMIPRSITSISDVSQAPDPSQEDLDKLFPAEGGCFSLTSQSACLGSKDASDATKDHFKVGLLHEEMMEVNREKFGDFATCTIRIAV